MGPFSPTDEEKIASNVLACWSSDFQHERSPAQRRITTNAPEATTHSEQHNGHSDVDEDGVHGGRMKPLASLNVNTDIVRDRKSPPYCAKVPFSPANLPSAKVLAAAAARAGRRAKRRSRMASHIVRQKENDILPQMKDMQVFDKLSRGKENDILPQMKDMQVLAAAAARAGRKAKRRGKMASHIVRGSDFCEENACLPQMKDMQVFGKMSKGVKRKDVGPAKGLDGMISFSSVKRRRSALATNGCLGVQTSEPKQEALNMSLVQLERTEPSNIQCSNLPCESLPGLSKVPADSSTTEASILPLSKEQNNIRTGEPDSIPQESSPQGLRLLGAAACSLDSDTGSLQLTTRLQKDESSFTTVMPGSRGCPVGKAPSESLPISKDQLITSLPSMKPPTYPKVKHEARAKSQPVCQREIMRGATVDRDSTAIGTMYSSGANIKAEEKSMHIIVKIEESSGHSVEERAAGGKQLVGAQARDQKLLFSTSEVSTISTGPPVLPEDLESKEKVFEGVYRAFLTQSDQPDDCSGPPLIGSGPLRPGNSPQQSEEGKIGQSPCLANVTNQWQPPVHNGTLLGMSKDGQGSEMNINAVDMDLAVEGVRFQAHSTSTLFSRNASVGMNCLTLEIAKSQNQGIQKQQEALCSSNGEAKGNPGKPKDRLCHSEQYGQKVEQLHIGSMGNTIPSLQQSTKCGNGICLGISAISTSAKWIFPYNALANPGSVVPKGVALSLYPRVCIPKVRRGRQPKKTKFCPQQKEHINKFARVCAPSGLLGEFNPGIINRIRDRKQVYSVLGAIVGSFMGDSSLRKKDAPLQCPEVRQEQKANQELYDECNERSPKRRKSANMEEQRISGSNTAQEAASVGALSRDVVCVTGDGTVTTTKVLDRIGKQQNQERTVDKNAVNTYMKKPATTTEDINAVNMYIKEPATTTEEHGDDVPTSNSDCYLSKQAIDSRETNEIIETITYGKPRVNKLGCGVDFCGDARMGDGGQSFVEGLSYQAGHFSNKVSSNELIRKAETGTAVCTAASVAACWLQLLHLDIKGRLSALKRSRRRVRNVIISGHLEDKPACGKARLGKPPMSDGVEPASYFTKVTDQAMQWSSGPWGQDEEMDMWRAFFSHMDGLLSAEGARLESWLNEITDMQAQCQNNNQDRMRRLGKADCQLEVLNPLEEKVFRTWSSADAAQKDRALAASAVSILSTAQFATNLEIKS